VQDLDEVVQAAKTRRPKDQEEGKIKFEAHDFFEPQPIENADVYLLRFICYDHSDKYAAKMANIESAMGPTSRIIIMDGVLPPPGTLSRAEERRLR
jgi:6-hydroxytryprostatin B O-methyltransferase